MIPAKLTIDTTVNGFSQTLVDGQVSQYKKDSTWTMFNDRYSGGSRKLDTKRVWIEAEEEQAITLFQEIFGLSPNNISCSCCGEDFSFDEREFLPNNNDWIVDKNHINAFKSKD